MKYLSKKTGVTFNKIDKLTTRVATFATVGKNGSTGKSRSIIKSESIGKNGSSGKSGSIIKSGSTGENGNIGKSESIIKSGCIGKSGEDVLRKIPLQKFKKTFIIEKRHIRISIFKDDEIYKDPLEVHNESIKQTNFLNSGNMEDYVYNRSNVGMNTILLNTNYLNMKAINKLYKELRDSEINHTKRFVFLTSLYNHIFSYGFNLQDFLKIIEIYQKTKNKKYLDLFKKILININDLAYLIFSFRKPLISYCNGKVKGSGGFLSFLSKYSASYLHSSYSFNNLAYSFLPYGGISFVLTNLRASLGFYLALTGQTICGPDLIWTGLTRRWVSDQALDLMEVTSESQLEVSEQDANILLEEHFLKIPKIYSLKEYEEIIHYYFKHDNLLTILQKLEKTSKKKITDSDINSYLSSSKRYSKINSGSNSDSNSDSGLDADLDFIFHLSSQKKSQRDIHNLKMKNMEKMEKMEKWKKVQNWAKRTYEQICSFPPLATHLTFEILNILRNYKMELLTKCQINKNMWREIVQNSYKVPKTKEEVSMEELKYTIDKELFLKSLNIETNTLLNFISNPDVVTGITSYLVKDTQHAFQSTYMNNTLLDVKRDILLYFLYYKNNYTYQIYDRPDISFSSVPVLEKYNQYYNDASRTSYDRFFYEKQMRQWDPNYLKAELDEISKNLS